jgi:predicted MFS family arabinose efflux permease
VLFAIEPVAVYAVAAGLLLAGLTAVLMLREPARLSPDDLGRPPALDSLLTGIRFIRGTPVMMGAITLDLFAVLFGGAVALLPAFARSILHVGPIGLGLLRTAPALGALAAGALLTMHPPRARAGRTLIVVVGVFGASMVVFALSHSFLLSLAALAVSGFVDMVSMNIRGTIAALAVPDEVRGRVLAVELVFLSASNELGAFESGMAAALIGTAPAVLAGGVATIALAAVWTKLFPDLARVDRLEDLHPEVSEVAADVL